MSSTDTLGSALTDLLDLSGQTALITGGATGIGRGIADRLHEAGAAIVIADQDAEGAATAAADLDARRAGSAHGVVGDVTIRADVDAMVAATVERFGGVDILVNNAGIYPMVPFLEMDPDLFERVLRVNLLGAFLAAKAVAPRMIAQGRGGKIINITSVDALHPSGPGLVHYDASKHGAWGLTKSVALELAPYGIAVNAVAPGIIKTPGTGGDAVDPAVVAHNEARIPMGRLGEPHDIGRVVLFLASGLASYLTGSQIVADGGVLLA
jgi:2-deoxy-D-gluconate 3-dehydrogenase